MSHDIVDFQKSFLGNVFGEIPRFKKPETIDFIDFSKFFPEIYQKWEFQKCFFGKWKKRFWENTRLGCEKL